MKTQEWFPQPSTARLMCEARILPTFRPWLRSAIGSVGVAWGIALLAAAPAIATQTVAYAYDAAGRLTSATYDDTLTTRFTYDANGNLLVIETAPVASDVPEGSDLGLLPRTFALQDPAPNPLQETATLTYQLPRTSSVRLEIYGASGRRLRTLVNGVLPAGYYMATWDGRDDRGRPVGSAVYFARLQAGEFQQSAPLTVLR